MEIWCVKILCEIVLGNGMFFINCNGRQINSNNWIKQQRKYVNNHLEGYHTSISEKNGIIGVCGNHGSGYNARVLSHEMIHHVLCKHIDKKSSIQFDILCWAPLEIDGLGGSKIKYSMDELKERCKEREDEIKR